VRLKFQQPAGSRVNNEDLAIFAPVEEIKEPKLYFNGNINEMTAIQDSESTISEATLITEDNEESVIVTVDGNFELSLDQQSWNTSLTLDASGESFYVRMASTATVGEYEGIITATAGTVTAYADVEGEVTSQPYILGDVNMDGLTNIADVTALIDHLLGSTLDQFNELAADVDQNETINIADVAGLIDLLLNGPQSMVWYALPSSKGIIIINPDGVALEVFDMDANLVATSSNSQEITLGKGIYLVSSENRSRKVVVK
jgi:hypothetical protein